MKLLMDLKEEILSGKRNKMYVFFGQDFGLRKHYIQKLAEDYDEIKVIDSALQLAEASTGNSLFNMPTLYLVYNDMEFAKQRPEIIETVIKRISDDKMLIMDYEDLPETTTLFKEFGDLVTNFSNVKDKIAYEFIDSEIKLTQANKEELAYNCENNYNKILLESDKIKNYKQKYNLTDERAFEELSNSGQLIYRCEEFNCDLLMNDLLSGNRKNYALWLNLINTEYLEKFWYSLNRVMNDLLIAYLIKRYGKYEGSSKAYNLGLSWGRAKIIREFNIPYDADYLLYLVYEITNIDYKVKTGTLQQENIFNYLMSIFI